MNIQYDKIYDDIEKYIDDNYKLLYKADAKTYAQTYKQIMRYILEKTIKLPAEEQIEVFGKLINTSSSHFHNKKMNMPLK